MRRSNRGRTAVLALLTLLAFGTAACGDDGDDESSATTTPTTAAPVQGQPVVNIDMVDHAYQVSGALVAGGTLRIANRGTEFHMMGLGRFKPGRTIADLQRALAEAGPPAGGAGTTTSTVARTTTTTARGATTTTSTGATTSTTARGATTTTTAAGGAAGGQEQDPTAEVVDMIGLPGNLMGRGQSVELTVPTLAPGTYALVCFLPTEGEGTPHFAKGMVGQLEVVPGPAPALPTADAIYRLAPDRAVDGPTTLTAGRHTLQFEAAPGSGQLEPVLAKLNQGATFQRLETALDNLFEGDDPPARGAAGRLPGQIVFGGQDLNEVTTFYLATDFTAGTYVIVAEDTDTERPGPPREMITVRVS